MAQAASIVTTRLVQLLRSPDGLAARLQALALSQNLTEAVGSNPEIIARNIAPDLAEKSSIVKYPALYVYCAKLENALREKFRRFSGTVEMHIDIRLSHEHMDDLERLLQLYVDAVSDVLDRNRGTWTQTMFYTGGYEVVFAPLKRGGKNYLQTAKLLLEVNISLD